MDFSRIPAAIAKVIHSSYGDAIGRVFMWSAIISVVSIIAVCCMKSTLLRGTINTAASVTDKSAAAAAERAKLAEQVGSVLAADTAESAPAAEKASDAGAPGPGTEPSASGHPGEAPDADQLGSGKEPPQD
jgi:hypothetical protein